MKWYYCPFSVRFIGDNEAHSNSGVNLILKDSYDHVLLEYSLTINSLPKKKLNELKIYVSNEELISRDKKEINWYESKIDFNLPIMNNELREFFNFFKLNGFNLLPLDLVDDNIDNFTLLNIRTGLSSKLSDYKYIEFVDGKVSDTIEIVSFPFNFTNPILFSKFKSPGHINYQLKDNELKSMGYITDIKYLENMLGAMVNNKDGSIGLTFSNIKKFNGDGDLTFILSWKKIFHIIGNNFPNNSYLRQSIPLSLPKLSTQGKSVLPIVLTIANYKQTWGSCIMFNKEYLITNTHVLKPYISNSNRTECLIYLNDGNNITLSKDDIIHSPLAEIDLSFIKLSLKNQYLLANDKSLMLVRCSRNHNIGDAVSTVGYGLYFNKSYLNPIICHGSISTQENLKFNDNERIPSIIITSASCWNGSSGGGLFNEAGELIGIICSNAQVNLPNLPNNDKKIEKLSRFCFVLPTSVILKCFEMINFNYMSYKVDEEFTNTWNLIGFHEDKIVSNVDERQAKL